MKCRWTWKLAADGTTYGAVILIEGCETHSGYVLESRALNNERALNMATAAPAMYDALTKSFIDHYSERDGLDSCPCSSVLEVVPSDLCTCGATEHNARIRNALNLALGVPTP